MADCIPNDLLDDGRCFQCSTEQQFWMMALQLLCDIGDSSSGEIQRVFHFPSDPNGSVVAPDPAIGYGDDGSLWVKTNGVTDNTGWEPLMGAFMPSVNRVIDQPVQVVLATSRLDPELVLSPTFSSSFVKTPEPSIAVKKNADSFLKRMGNWFASNVWVWSFVLVLAVLTDTAKAQLPPPFIRNQMDTNPIVYGTNGITIHSIPGMTVISNTVGALTNANDVLNRLLTNGSIRTLSGVNGITITNQGTNLVIAAPDMTAALTNANSVLDRLLTNNSIKTLSITGGSISNQGTNLHFTVSPSSALTNANLVLLSWLTNGGAAIKTVSAGSGISITNEGTNLVFASSVGSGDIVATLASNEVSIAGATVLTASAYGTMHVMTGTSNYLVTLPAVAGNGRRNIGFRVGVGFTNFVTLTNSSLIDGSSARIMWKSESAVILCDGSTYTKIAGRSIPMSAQLSLSPTQLIANATWTKINLNVVDFDATGQMADAVNSRMFFRRPGFYIVNAVGGFGNSATNFLVIGSQTALNSDTPPTTSVSTMQLSATGGFGILAYPGTKPNFVAGDYVTLGFYQSSGGSRTFNIGVLTALESPTW